MQNIRVRGQVDAAIFVAKLRRKLSLIDGPPGDPRTVVHRDLTGAVSSSSIPWHSRQAHGGRSHLTYYRGALGNILLIYNSSCCERTPDASTLQRLGWSFPLAKPRRQNVLNFRREQRLAFHWPIHTELAREKKTQCLDSPYLAICGLPIHPCRFLKPAVGTLSTSTMLPTTTTPIVRRASGGDWFQERGSSSMHTHLRGGKKSRFGHLCSICGTATTLATVLPQARPDLGHSDPAIGDQHPNGIYSVAKTRTGSSDLGLGVRSSYILSLILRSVRRSNPPWHLDVFSDEQVPVRNDAIWTLFCEVLQSRSRCHPRYKKRAPERDAPQSETQPGTRVRPRGGQGKHKPFHTNVATPPPFPCGWLTPHTQPSPPQSVASARL